MARYLVTKYICVEQDIDIDGKGEPHVVHERILYEGDTYDECEKWMANNKGMYREIDTVIKRTVEEW